MKINNVKSQDCKGKLKKHFCYEGRKFQEVQQKLKNSFIYKLKEYSYNWKKKTTLKPLKQNKEE